MKSNVARQGYIGAITRMEPAILPQAVLPLDYSLLVRKDDGCFPDQVLPCLIDSLLNVEKDVLRAMLTIPDASEISLCGMGGEKYPLADDPMDIVVRNS